MENLLKWITTHWLVLALAFASGSAIAYQEIERSKLEAVVVKQSEQDKQLSKTAENISKLQIMQQVLIDAQKNQSDKLDKLIDLQLRRNNTNAPTQ